MKILIIDAHPNADSLCTSLAYSYKKGAVQSGAEVKELVLRDLDFNPNLAFGFQKRTELEQDLLDAWDDILWADHLVWVHPVWWGGLPAIAKGFIDRLFLPGIAFSYRENSVWWDKHLAGKTGHIICTSDQPYWYYWLVNGRPAVNQLKKMVLEFCGVSSVKVTMYSPVRNSTHEAREKFVAEAYQIGMKSGQLEAKGKKKKVEKKTWLQVTKSHFKSILNTKTQWLKEIFVT